LTTFRTTSAYYVTKLCFIFQEQKQSYSIQHFEVISLFVAVKLHLNNLPNKLNHFNPKIYTQNAFNVILPSDNSAKV